MKSIIKKMRVSKYSFLFGFLAMIIVAVMYYLLTGDAEVGVCLANVPFLGTVSTEATRDKAGEMGRNIVSDDIDKKITLVRPSNSVLDTMLRTIGAVQTDSEIIVWGESGFGEAYVQNLTAVSQNAANTTVSIRLTPDTFKQITVSSSYAYKDDVIGKYVGLYIIQKNTTNQEIICRVIGGAGAGDQLGSNGILPSTKLYFYGVAKHELDAQTEAMAKLPVFYDNYCQIQMAQVEQGIYDQMQKKDVDWGLLNFKADALYKFRYGCEMTALTGIKSKTTDSEDKAVLTAGGLENYVGWNMNYVPGANNAGGGIDNKMIIKLGESIFASIAGSDSKLFCPSPQLMTEFLNVIEFNKMMSEAKTKLVYGIECSEIQTGFGKLNIKVHRGLGLSRPGEGFITDLENVRLKVFDPPMRWRPVNLYESGQSKADAWVLEERSALEVRVAATHAWVYPVANSGNAGIIKVS